MKINELSQLELDEISEWSLAAQITAIILMLIFLQVSGWFFYFRPQIQALEVQKQQEVQLKRKVAENANEVALLPEVLKQQAELHRRLSVVSGRLPLQKDLPGLLAKVNQTGLNHRLTVLRINLEEPEKGEYFDRLPFSIEVAGYYHDISAFFSSVSALSVMVSFQEAELTRVAPASDKLTLKAKAFTYQLKEEAENGKAY